jgi:ABC-type nitrate/sulfonate/bicarbonate transport system substrate-binding protein
MMKRLPAKPLKLLFAVTLLAAGAGMPSRAAKGENRACWFFHYLHAPATAARPVGLLERVVYSFILANSEAAEPRAPNDPPTIPAS